MKCSVLKQKMPVHRRVSDKVSQAELYVWVSPLQR